MPHLLYSAGVLTPVFERAQEQPQGAAELLKRQEELEKKAAELDRREREMQTLSASGGERRAGGGLRGGRPSASGPLALFCFRQEKQLAAPAGEFPGGSLFLPRHHGGHPRGVPEDGPDHVLSVDV